MSEPLELEGLKRLSPIQLNWLRGVRLIFLP